MALQIPFPRRFAREEWNIGFVHQPIEDIARHGLTEAVEWLPTPGPWGMLADPACLFRADGSRVILIEYLNQWLGRGEIWTADLPEKGNPADMVFRRWMQSTQHLSYPHPFLDRNGTIFLVAESWEAGALHLWQEQEFGLTHIGPIIKHPVVDPTPWYDGTTWWLFCTFQDDGPNERLRIFHAQRPEGPWTLHTVNPAKIDLGSSRPAGPLFRVDGKLLRPAQDCSKTYGGAVILNEVIRLDHHGFEEIPYRRLEPDDAYPHGIHTLCPAGEITIVDGKRWCFQPLDVPRKFLVLLQSRARRWRKWVVPQHLKLPKTMAPPEVSRAVHEQPAHI